MSMLKLKPACTDYLWGGERLRAEYGVESDKHPLAEAWVLSCHPDGPSTIVGAPTTAARWPTTLPPRARPCWEPTARSSRISPS